ncbi:hypothetical protein K491DRAFT_713449 [Lophiostoma macrostomum CBS 122681]|uniref:Uncharacterized protein n=1 Tax=Lophiostoma macrostomum CBS 122681 TaxID=1314788 RepID=A0A6A6TFL6_9PLEO|nr:hypothetical protein K491DRAFT_713449 [Lophiostoma macrostomum CBS 122681]
MDKVGDDTTVDPICPDVGLDESDEVADDKVPLFGGGVIVTVDEDAITELLVRLAGFTTLGEATLDVVVGADEVTERSEMLADVDRAPLEIGVESDEITEGVDPTFDVAEAPLDTIVVVDDITVRDDIDDTTVGDEADEIAWEDDETPLDERSEVETIVGPVDIDPKEEEAPPGTLLELPRGEVPVVVVDDDVLMAAGPKLICRRGNGRAMPCDEVEDDLRVDRGVETELGFELPVPIPLGWVEGVPSMGLRRDPTLMIGGGLEVVEGPDPNRGFITEAISIRGPRLGAVDEAGDAGLDGEIVLEDEDAPPPPNTGRPRLSSRSMSGLAVVVVIAETNVEVVVLGNVIDVVEENGGNLPPVFVVELDGIADPCNDVDIGPAAPVLETDPVLAPMVLVEDT